jgi:proteic killer suppression protein
VILSFACKETEKIFQGQRSRKLPTDIQTRARRKLMQLENAQTLNDMRIPPSNRLEALSGDLAGSWSVRINQQWRLVFHWEDGNASEVQVMDYH